jgi:hypothetical protein
MLAARPPPAMQTLVASSQDRHSPELAMRHGAHMVTTSEKTDAGGAEARIKQMTGGDHDHCSTRVAGEAALTHIVKDKNEAAQRRSDLFERRRELMVTWDAFVAAGTAEAITLRRTG